MIDRAVHSGGCNVGIVVGLGKVFAVGEGFGEGGGSDRSRDGTDFGVGDSR